MKDIYIELANDCYISPEYSNEELVTFALIQKTYNKAKHTSTVNINLLLDYMYCRHDNARIVKKIREAIVSLYNKGLIKNIYDVHYKEINFVCLDNKTNFIVEIEPLEANYFKVYENSLDKIFNYLSKTKIKKFSFVRYFIAISRVIHSETNFGYLTQKQCESFIENDTITNYNKILQDELQLIRYCNDYLISQYQYCNTYFGRFDDEANFNFQLNFEVERLGLVKTNKSKSNAKRSVKQKVNTELINTDTSKSNLSEEINNFDLDGSIIKTNINAFDWDSVEYTDEDSDNLPTSLKLTELSYTNNSRENDFIDGFNALKDKEILESCINNVDLLKKFLSPNDDYYAIHIEQIENGICKVEEFFEQWVEYDEYEDYIKFIRTQIEYDNLTLCSICGKKHILKSQKLCSSCKKAYDKNQERAEQWKLENVI